MPMIEKAESPVRRIGYVCNQCQARDRGKFFAGEVPHPAITCWKCKSGSGKDLGLMIQTGTGMSPVGEKSDEWVKGEA